MEHSQFTSTNFLVLCRVSQCGPLIDALSAPSINAIAVSINHCPLSGVTTADAPATGSTECVARVMGRVAEGGRRCHLTGKEPARGEGVGWEFQSCAHSLVNGLSVRLNDLHRPAASRSVGSGPGVVVLASRSFCVLCLPSQGIREFFVVTSQRDALIHHAGDCFSCHLRTVQEK